MADANEGTKQTPPSNHCSDSHESNNHRIKPSSNGATSGAGDGQTSESSHLDKDDPCMFDLGRLRKDDSGIAVGVSPAPSNSTEGDTSRIDNDSGCVGADEGPTSSLLGDLTATEDESQGAFRSLPQSDSDDDDDEEDNANHTGPGSRKRRRNRGRSCSNSSTTTSSNVEDPLSDDKSDSEEDVEEMEVEAPPMRDTWHPLLELRRREVGSPNHVPAHMIFRNKTTGSLQMVQRLKLQAKLQHHEGCVNALHFNKAGTLLASGSDDLNVVLWDWVTGRPYLAYDSGHRSNVFQAKFMPYSGDCHVVSCARDGQVRLAELSSTGVCKSTKKLSQHRGAAHKLAMLQDSSHVFYSCGEDAVVFEVDLRQDKPNKLCTTMHNDKKVSLYSIHANPFKSQEYCLGGRDQFIRIYDTRMIESGGKPLKKYCPHHLIEGDMKANVTCAVYNWNGEEVLGTFNDEDIYMFDNYHSDSAEYVKRFQGHRNNATVKGVNFYGPKSEYVISGSDCSNVFLWDKETERIVQYFHGDEGGVINVLEPHPHSPILATSGLDHDVKIWSPTAETSTKLTGLKKTTKRNIKEREDERVNEPDMIDGQMLWFFMQQLRRTARRHGRADGEEISPSSSEPDSDEDDEETDARSAAMQCSQS